MRSFNDFVEPMAHEFQNVTIELSKQGVKLDGDTNSLKIHCKLNEYKSVDYIYLKRDKFPLVEFSDIGRQQNQILLQIDEIKSSNLDRKLITNLVKNHHKKVHTELVQKYKDTLSIISNLHKYVSDIPINLQKSGFLYYIVVPPLHNEIGEKKAEIARFLDDLESKITLAIPDQIYERVQIVLVEVFEKNH